MYLSPFLQPQNNPAMDELQAKHRKELKDLQARITQKKKSATKKTRKGVNDECDNLEHETKERQAAEIAALSSSSTTDTTKGTAASDDLVNGAASLSLIDSHPSQSPESVNRPSIPAATMPPPTDEAQSDFHKKPNRAKARLARRAAEQEALFNQGAQEASNLPNLKAQERERMVSYFKARNLNEKEIRADGHCLYSAFADQMDVLGLSLTAEPAPKGGIFRTVSNGFRKSSDAGEGKLGEYKIVRKAAADYIEAHPDDFVPFLEETLSEYVHKVRDTGEWGGQLELLALARSYGVQINVLQGDGRVEEIMPEQEAETKMWLAYYRHGFGLGEHYNSLRKVN